MIVGTAGHIDHGKTTLVRALTGVDTDRLPEEKQRGISIELGYAFLDLPGLTQRIGFIDVPGHERLVHTMLAGATGIDLALLLVAADDGVMPQTREHLAVLSLLGLRRGIVVVTKRDRVDDARLAAVLAEAGALLQHTTLQGAPVLAVSSHTGDGLAALRDHLAEAARTLPARGGAGLGFRLAIDRAFTLAGVGTVVTGTVHAGQVALGDALSLVPEHGGARDTVRVRSLHAQNQGVLQAGAGQRCALGLAGVPRERISRGQWLVAPDLALATDRLDAQLTLWPGEARALRSGTPVHVHLGAADVMGSVAVLARDGQPADTLLPGETGLVQLLLRQPVGAWHGDRVVLRDAAASRTLAGGTVLDVLAPVRYRRTPARLAELAAQSAPDAPARLAALLAASAQGVALGRWRAAQGLAAEAADPTDPSSPRTALPLPAGSLHRPDASGGWVLGAAQAQQAAALVRARLAAFHAAHPEELGPDAARLRRLAQPRLPDPLWQALLAGLQTGGVLLQRGAFVHLPEHGLRLSAVDERIAQKVAPRLAQAGFEGAWARDLARDCAEGEALMRTTLARLAQRGELHQVVKDLYLAPGPMAALAAIARQLAGPQARGDVSAAAFRDATQLGRKRAIQLLEYFDRVGLLRRVGDVHRLRADSTLFSEAALA